MRCLLYKLQKPMALVLCVLLLLCGCGDVTFSTEFTAMGADSGAVLQQVLDRLDTGWIGQIAQRLSAYRMNENQGHLLSGTAAGSSAAADIASVMEEIGLKDVSLQEFSCDSVQMQSASMTLVSGEASRRYELGIYPTRTVGVSASQNYEMVYVGDGSPDEYEDLDVTSKAVLVICDASDRNVLDAVAETAEKAGAAAVIVAQEYSKNADRSGDVLLSGILSSDVRLPVFSITFSDAEQLQEAWDDALKKVTTKYKKGKKTYTETTYVRSPLMLSFDVTYSTAGEQTGGNVVGVIKGADDSQAILIGAAYDHWYEGYNGSLTSTGLMLALARAVEQSGYVPQKTLVFAACGGSVYGRHNEPYALHNGLQAQLSALEQSARDVVYALYIDAPSLDLGETLTLSTTVGMQNAVQQLLQGLESEIYEQGVTVTHTPSAAEGTFVCGEYGIGAVGISTAGSAAAGVLGTAADKAELFSAEALDFSAEIYARLLMGLDSAVLRPIDVTSYFSGAQSALDQLQLSDAGATAAFIKSVSLLEASVNNINNRYRMALASDNEDTVRSIGLQSAAVNRGLKQFAVRIAQHCSLADDSWQVGYWFEAQAELVSTLDKAVDELQLDDVDDAMELLAPIGASGLSGEFGAKMSSAIAARFEDGDRKAMTYLFNRAWNAPDLSSVYAALYAAEHSGEKDVDISAPLAALRAVLEEESLDLTQSLNAWKTAVSICSTQVEEMAALFTELHEFM